MNKQVTNWKRVPCKSAAGEFLMMDFPAEIDAHYKGTLLFRILSMPCKSPVSFYAAINILSEELKEAFFSGRLGREPGQYFWYIENFVSWISDCGFHIEVTGEEFEVSDIWRV